MTAEKLSRLKRDYKRLHRACFKILEEWARAPGFAQPDDGNKLNWKIYQMAMKAIKDAMPPEQLTR